MSGPTLRLIVVTFVWGVSFPCTRAWMRAGGAGPVDPLLSALTLIALRMPIAFAVLMLSQPRLLRATAREWLAGGVIGAVFLLGFVLQTWGLASTTPALSGFFTAVSGAWVPPVVMALGQRVAPLTLLGLGVGLVGCAVLVEGGWRLGPGEWLTLAASFTFAAQMVLLDRFGKALRPERLSAGFLLVNAVGAGLLASSFAAAGPGIGAWAGWTRSMLADALLPWLVVLLAVFPTALGFHWMNTYQPLVSPSRAALIYLLEPVFAAGFSIVVRAATWSPDYDAPTPTLVLGGGLILGGNLLVEWFGARKGEEAELRAGSANDADAE